MRLRPILRPILSIPLHGLFGRETYPDGAILHFDASAGFVDQTGNQTVTLIGDAYPTVTAGFAVNAVGAEWGFDTTTGPVKAALESGEVTLVQVVTLPLMSSLTDATDYSLFGDLLFVRRDGTAGGFKVSDGTNSGTLVKSWTEGEKVMLIVRATDGGMSVFSSSELDGGVSARSIEPFFYGQCVAGEYASNASILGDETIASKYGTATVTVSAGRVTFGEGTLWSFVMSNGSSYEYPVKIGDGTAVWFDTSGNMRHLVCSVASVDTHCASGSSFGSNWANSHGYIDAQNLLFYGMDLTTDAWMKTFSAAITGKNVVNLPADQGRVYQTGPNLTIGQTLTVAIVLSGVPGTTVKTVPTGYAADGSFTTTLTATPTLYKYTATAAANRTPALPRIIYRDGTTATSVTVHFVAAAINNTSINPIRSNNLRIGGKQPVQYVDSAPKTIVCIGDSTTAGDYPNPLSWMLPNSTVIDAGVGSNTVAMMVARFQADVLDKNPDYVLYYSFINSLAGVESQTIKDQISAMITATNEAGKKFIIGTGSPFGGHAIWTEELQTKFEEINDWILNTVTGCYAKVDIYNALVDPGTDALRAVFDPGDHLHPNLAHSIKVAETFYAAIPKTLRTQRPQEFTYPGGVVTDVEFGAAYNLATCDGILPTSAQVTKGHALPIGVGKITIFPGVATAAQIEEAK